MEAKKTIKNSEIKIVKSSPLKSVVKVTKDADGQLTKKLATSKIATSQFSFLMIFLLI